MSEGFRAEVDATLRRAAQVSSKLFETEPVLVSQVVMSFSYVDSDGVSSSAFIATSDSVYVDLLGLLATARLRIENAFSDSVFDSDE